MAQPYVGEIRMFAGNFAPAGWMFCEGQLLPISENETLFNLIGTTYGGDGQSTFALPDLRGRLPIHFGQRLHPGRDRRRRRDHADRRADSRAHATRSWHRRTVGIRPSPAEQCAGADAGDDHALRSDAPDDAAGPRRDRAQPVAASRTTTSSRTCASTSSFRCSGSSRRQT